jgi:poly(A) polymerase
MSPRILPRPEHKVSRRDIDADALKVLYRLKNHGYVAYMVGGGVRDLLLGRTPKDFDIGTSAHPQQVKRLFRNCFIVGRRFRLCHVRFGIKVVEVSTFRKQAEPEEGDTLIRRDNTFGTPEEDAFRRDFTVNALFYDIGTFAVIDYVGGLEDLAKRVIRMIGDPGVRLREDPVRMVRAVALAARLHFTIDRDTLEAIRALRGEIMKSSAARLLEEVYKILRQGESRATFEALHEVGLLAYLLPEADRAVRARSEAFLGSLSRLDDYRRAGLTPPEGLGNALLLGTMLVPLGVPLRSAPSSRRRRPGDHRGKRSEEAKDTEGEDVDVEAEMEALDVTLSFARRDVDRLRLILLAQRRLREVDRALGVKQALAGRSYFEDALRWLEIHGGPEAADLAAHWRSLEIGDVAAPRAGDANAADAPGQEMRPRRRRRRRRRGGPTTHA